jgi:hypothetical protein
MLIKKGKLSKKILGRIVETTSIEDNLKILLHFLSLLSLSLSSLSLSLSLTHTHTHSVFGLRDGEEMETKGCKVLLIGE